MTDETLLPCPNPWCNESKPRIIGDSDVGRARNGRLYVNVFCDNCDVGPAPSFRSRAEAVAAWNTRPAPADVGELVCPFDEDDLEEIITDTLDMDWQPRWAARAIIRHWNERYAPEAGQ